MHQTPPMSQAGHFASPMGFHPHQATVGHHGGVHGGGAIPVMPPMVPPHLPPPTEPPPDIPQPPPPPQHQQQNQVRRFGNRIPLNLNQHCCLTLSDVLAKMGTKFGEFVNSQFMFGFSLFIYPYFRCYFFLFVNKVIVNIVI